MAQTVKVAFIGFGEAAGAFRAGWRDAGLTPSVAAFDIKTAASNPAICNQKWNDYAAANVTGGETPGAALDGATIILSLVTADQALNAARAAADCIPAGALYCDGNSCAPGTKTQAAHLIEAAGGRYVDMAVMAPVYPKRHHTPLLLAGPHADDALAALTALDMKAKVAGPVVGAASSIKMIRSIMMKGMEALFLECVLAGRKAGVDDVVLSSLDVTYPGFDFKAKAAYMQERVMTHGIRRAAEMREVARTVDDLGLGGTMARATVDWQQRVGDLKLDAKAIGADDYGALADAILAKLGAV